MSNQFRRAFKEDGPPPYADVFEDAEINKRSSKSVSQATPFPYSESEHSHHTNFTGHQQDRTPKPVVRTK